MSISDVGHSKAVTLMSADVERVTRGLGMLHETWGSLAEACIALWLLDEQLGLSALAPLGVALGKYLKHNRFSASPSLSDF